MASNKVEVSNIANAISKELEGYRQDVTDNLKQDIKIVAKECKNDIQQNSPVLTGSYRKGWHDKVAYEGQNDVRVVVRNRTDYQLAHLLEYGHAGAGGTAKGVAPPHPHIGPAAERAEEKLLKKVKVVVRG